VTQAQIIGWFKKEIVKEIRAWECELD